ncbi:uncharacterized protein LOC117648506 [Thrips palmi]|uniref:Uncharacterized protein LOC117648506 n=1 Tax=Thrips palmi TaxID=161013 RepID=A0A6P8Z343_THRPL|nr:uncharacterized protein LOC117648506 [Thrips palmi]
MNSAEDYRTAMEDQRRSRRLEAKRGALVDVLPDEILTQVFSNLSDGRTLLDTLPLVCKRWCRVARDPASWAGVRLVVKNDVADEARILRRAPAARSLEIEARWARRCFTRKSYVRKQYAAGGRYGPINRCRLRAALRFSNVTVRESVTILEKGWWVAKLPKLCWPQSAAKTPKSSIARFLARQPQLRELRLLLAAEAEGAASLAAIARMRRLQTLELVTLPGAAETSPTSSFQDAGSRPRPVGQDAVGAVRRAFELALQMKTPALRYAAVSLCRGEHGRFSFLSQSEFVAVRDEFALQMPDVVVELLVDGPSCAECGYSKACPGLGWNGEANSDDDDDSDAYY